ncbi:aminotransferase class I/II-fold pyridoxal phosphate-dependent enzyme, partial [Acinetobacter baumannii]
MTGWRLGWLVLPPALVPQVEKLAQNLLICASSIAQHAAMACFTPETLAIYEERKAEFKRRRDYIVPALESLGFTVPV